MKIIWSEEARLDFEQNIHYLVQAWTEESAKNFIQEVEAVIELIRENPKLFPLSDYKNVRRAVIRKQVTLFYKEDDSSIYLVRFWNTYQNPDSLKIKP
ncbi:MAG: type II toxin-antitoxin system RelE/ParE family toxin [Cyclobacteriaceae bacterium]